MSRFVISCGGTGGHLAPGIALGEALLARGDGAVLLTSRRRVDAELSSRYAGLTFVPMPGSGFGWSPGVLARFVWSQTKRASTPGDHPKPEPGIGTKVSPA